jgi:hypothetical protein
MCLEDWKDVPQSFLVEAWTKTKLSAKYKAIPRTKTNAKIKTNGAYVRSLL